MNGNGLGSDLTSGRQQRDPVVTTDRLYSRHDISPYRMVFVDVSPPGKHFCFSSPPKKISRDASVNFC